MKKTILFVTLAIAFISFAFSPAGNVLITHTGHISFFSKATMENIEANNYQVSSSLNTSNGEMAFSVLVKSFQFEKAKMQEHFNENYMESDKYPKSTFKGSITDFKSVNLGKDGTYKVHVAGDLTIHGVTKKVDEPGTITVKGSQINAKSSFPIKIADYNITIPAVVKDKVAEVVTVSVDMTYDSASK